MGKHIVWASSASCFNTRGSSGIPSNAACGDAMTLNTADFGVSFQLGWRAHFKGKMGVFVLPADHLVLVCLNQASKTRKSVKEKEIFFPLSLTKLIHHPSVHLAPHYLLFKTQQASMPVKIFPEESWHLDRQQLLSKCFFLISLPSLTPFLVLGINTKPLK